MPSDIKEFLSEQGLSTEEINAIVGNEKSAAAMSRALARYDEGTSALSAAQAEKSETQEYWTRKTQELEGAATRLTAAERRAAVAESQSAARYAYLKSLKDQGYDVPDSVLDAAAPKADPAAPRDPANGQYMTREDFEKARRATAPDLVTLTALSNEYQYLHGQPYTSIQQDFEEAVRAGKPFGEYARTKHKFEEKKAAKLQAAEDERVNKLVEDRYKAKEAELVAKYGSNPELNAPVPSKFDRLQKREGFKSDSWKSQEGRDAARATRLKQFENIRIN